ncbi:MULTISPECIES: DNA topoisomerase IV subunit A [Terrabacteria group]|uniref:DNA topoisomerase IV subunit A n=1 Tax=Bacillati TaxID=1783272 RepID=UPI001C6E87C2|nr:MULTISPECIES: DNA topoisomerase IV subunit A [Terrabacteria group]MBW9212093.1 DNA topoisomerase IV subunit A [Trueperella sp. zg.1013]
MTRKKEWMDHTRYLNQRLEDIMGAGFGRYAKYIIQERALPDARDGLKPVQRRILYAMYNDGNTYDKPYRKSAKTVGLVIGNYHPHGDTSVYDAMVRMSQDWKVRMPFIDMHGNNGSIDDDPAAAMRYTEARLAKVSQVMEEDLDKNTVEMSPNFDDTDVEPTVLPVAFPVMLVNGATGIAAGYATNMPPHNINEVVDATIYRIQNPDCELKDVMDIIPGPDFPTGGIVQGEEGIRAAFTSGKGRIVVRAKTEIIQERNFQQIIITEIPYEVVKANLVKKMDEIRVSKEVDGLMDVRDESDRNGLRIVVDVRKDADANLILQYFFKNTDLQVCYNYNNVAIIKETPVQVGLLKLLDAFIVFRKEVVLRRARFELNKMEARVHIIEGLIKAVSILDEVIAMIRASKDKADSKRNLIANFGFDEIQAEAIVSLRLYRLSNTDIVSLRNEFAQLVNQIEETKSILENEAVLNHLMIQELRKVKEEYGDARRTKIEAEIDEINISKEAMIASEQVMLTVSKDGYLKRVSLRSFNAVRDQETGLKTGDQLIGQKEVNTLDTVLLLTSLGNYAMLPIWQIDDEKWKDIGSHLNKFVRVNSEEKIVSAIVVKSFDSYAWITLVTKGNKIKKTRLCDWKVERTSRLFKAINLEANDEVCAAFMTYQNQEVVVLTKDGYALRMPQDQIPEVKTSKGVQAMKVAEEDEVVYATSVHVGENLLFMTNALQAKRIHLEELRLSGRAKNMGERICKKNKSNPSCLLYVLAVKASQDLEFGGPLKQVLSTTDIPFKEKEVGFSALSLDKDYYLKLGIQEALIEDEPEVQKDQVSFQQLGLFEVEE